MPLAERAAAAVLAAQADRRAFQQQRAERQRSARPQSIGLRSMHVGVAALEQRDDLRVRLEVRGHGRRGARRSLAAASRTARRSRPGASSSRGLTAPLVLVRPPKLT